MNKLALALFALCTLSVALAAVHPDPLAPHFARWMQEHQRSYSNEEFIYRWNVWKDNMQFIADHNAKADKTYTVAMNKYGDLTAEEFSRIHKGLRFDGQSYINRLKSNFVPAKPAFVPASFDWRDKGAVSHVKDQGQCGSCWSFSATGSTEGAYFLQSKKVQQVVPLSEQNLVDCSGSYGNYGCNGGLMDYAFQYIIDNKGIDTESSYPYTAEDGSCHYDASNSGATLSSYQDVSSGDENALLNALVNQPVSVAIDASQSSFQFYSGGVYYEPSCSSTQLDHGVLAVGWGSESGSDYWLVKNSWGTGWGLSGYIKMARNKNNNCGIATAASYPTF